MYVHDMYNSYIIVDMLRDVGRAGKDGCEGGGEKVQTVTHGMDYYVFEMDIFYDIN